MTILIDVSRIPASAGMTVFIGASRMLGLIEEPFPHDLLESFQRELLCSGDAGILHGEGGRGIESLYGGDEFFLSHFRREEDAGFPVDDRLAYPGFVHADDGDAASHGLYGDHSEVLVFRDEYGGNRSGDISGKFVIVRERQEDDILVPLRQSEYLIFLGVVLPVDDEEFLVGHFPEGFDRTGDAF